MWTVEAHPAGVLRRAGRLLFRQQVPSGPVRRMSASFAGVKRNVPDIFRVRITSGNVVLSR